MLDDEFEDDAAVEEPAVADEANSCEEAPNLNFSFESTVDAA